MHLIAIGRLRAGPELDLFERYHHRLRPRLTVTELLGRLEIDARRVAVEHNVTVLKRTAFDETVVREGDEVEIVNFVGGG